MPHLAVPLKRDHESRIDRVVMFGFTFTFNVPILVFIFFNFHVILYVLQSISRPPECDVTRSTPTILKNSSF